MLTGHWNIVYGLFLENINHKFNDDEQAKPARKNT